MPEERTPEEEALFARIWSGIKEKLGWKSDDDETTGFKVVGNHWLAVWSNNFKDRDGEVFTAQAIDAYVKRVDTGLVKLPELWVWHGGKNVAIGNADWVARHGHFLMAMGQFYGGAPAQSAKAYYTKQAKNTGISHGFTFPSEGFDGKHYHRFNTFEISLLPRGTEANWYTSLEGVKAMAVDEKKLDYFKEVFGEHATRILEDWDKRGKALEELEVEFKDFVQPDTQQTAVKVADEASTKVLGELVTDLSADTGTAVEAALEAVKIAKTVDMVAKSVDAAQKQAEKAYNDALTTIRAEFRKELDVMKQLLGDRPRSATKDEATLVTEGALSAEVIERLNEQVVVKDGFWGTEVKKTP